MAGQKLPFFVVIGPSNCNGAGSLLSDVPGADLARVIGLPAFPSTTPASVQVPGIKLWQAKMPFAVSDVRNITDVPLTTQIETDGAAFGATNVGQWVYIATNTTGQGNLRRITAQAGNLLTVASAWSPTLSANGTVRLITGSRSVGALIRVSGTSDAGGSTSTMVDAALTEANDFWNGNRIQLTSGPDSGQIREIIDFDAATDTVIFSPAVTTAIGAGITYDIIQSTKVVTQDTTSVAFGAPDVGRWVKFASGESRKITALNGRSITLDNALLALPAVNTAIYVLDGAATADTLTNFAQSAAWKDLQFFLDVAPVFFTGFDYCNYRQAASSGPTGTSTSTLVNAVPELMTQLRYRFPDPIYGFTIGIDSAQAAPQYIGTSAQIVYFSWMHDVTHLDFHPSNATGIMGAVLAGIASAQALAIAQGDTLDPQGIFFIGLLENDTLDVQKLAHLGENVGLIRDKVRTALGNQRVPCVILGCSPSSVTLPNHDEDADRDSANEQALQLKLDDPWTGFIPTPQDAFIKHGDQIHYLAPGQIAIAQAAATEWNAIKERANSASRLLAELPTLSAIRTKVRRRYERSATGSDATAPQIDMFINDSIREIHNTLGDTAWFLRRAEEITLSQSFPGTIDLPRVCKRILRIERTAYPGHALTYKGISYTDSGRVQITLHDYSGGPFIVHYLAQWTDLVNDTDATLVPIDHMELIVMLTCKRLTECAGNAPMAGYYAAESERLWRTLKKENLRYDRMRQGQLEALGAMDSWSNRPWPGGDEWGL